MPAIRAQVTLKTADDDEGNYATNVFAFDDGSSATAAADATTLLTAFYNSVRPYLSPAIQQLDHTIKFYNLPVGPPPNYPFAETTFNLSTAPGGTQLPSEVALCVSFQGAYVSGLPQRRRRGRVYLGPLNTSSLGLTTEVGRPSSTARTALATAADTLMTNTIASSLGFWGVWSTVDNDIVEVTNGWIDDTYDTQRRRGVKETDRTVWN